MAVVEDTNTRSDIRIGVLALQGAFSEHVNMLRNMKTIATDKGHATITPIEVRERELLCPDAIDALIIPGGESTAMSLIAERSGLLEPLREWVRQGHPTWGVCAGSILLANNVISTKQGGQSTIGGLDITIRRNAFGRQSDSFQTQLHIPCLASASPHASVPTLTTTTSSSLEIPPRMTPNAATLFPGIFIRAPVIESVGPDVQVLCTLVGGKTPRVSGSGDGVLSGDGVSSGDGGGGGLIVGVRQGAVVATVFHPELTRDDRFHRFFVSAVVMHRYER